MISDTIKAVRDAENAAEQLLADAKAEAQKIVEDAESSAELAKQEALKKATTPIVKELSQSAIKKAANPEQHVTILVTNNRLGSMSDAYARISSIPGVSGVYTRTKQAGVMQIDVDYHGTAYDLAQALERDGITIREMTSEYIRI